MARPKGHGLHKRLAAVKTCRTVKKADMVHNDYLPHLQIDAHPTKFAPTARC